MTTIAIVDYSQRLVEDEVRLMTRACHVQLERHCAPLWYATPWPVRYYRRNARRPRDALALYVHDSPEDYEDADVAGYHTESARGTRYGRVFVSPILDDGGTVRESANSVSVTLSHEVLEAFIDPDLNLWAAAATGELYFYEICDPVQAYSYPIRLDGEEVQVSDFVLPAWFDSENPASAKYDYLDWVPEAFAVMPGGYTVYWDEDGEHVFEGYGYARRVWKGHRAARTMRRLSGTKARLARRGGRSTGGR